MLSNNETNSNVVEIQQLQQQNNSTPSPEGSLEQKIESLGKEIKSLRKQNRLNSGIIGLGVIGFIGYIVATNWSAIAPALVAAGTAIAAAAPVIGIAIGAIIGAAVLVGASYAIWKYRAQIKEGFKYAAEKTVDGAKHIGGKIKDGAVHAKDKIKSSTSHVVHNVSQSLDRLSSQTNYSDAMLNSQLLSDDAKGKIVSIKEQLMGIFNNEEIANKDKLLKKILKDIVLQIESKKDHAQGTDSEKYAPEWDKQINFIKDLNAEKLHDLLTKQSLPRDTYFLYTIFFEHHDKVERIVKQCKAEHRLSDGVEKLNEVAKRYGESRRGSMQSIENSLSKSSSLNSVRTDSTISSEAELLDPAKHKEVKTATSLLDKFSSPFKSGKKPKKTSESDTSSRQVGESTFYVAPPKPPRSNSLNSIGTVSTDAVPGLGSDNFATVNPNRLRRSNSSSSLTPQLTPAALPKVPGSPSIDSGMGSGSSTPKKLSLSSDDLGLEKPRTYKSEVHINLQQPEVTAGK